MRVYITEQEQQRERELSIDNPLSCLPDKVESIYLSPDLSIFNAMSAALQVSMCFLVFVCWTECVGCVSLRRSIFPSVYQSGRRLVANVFTDWPDRGAVGAGRGRPVAGKTIRWNRLFWGAAVFMTGYFHSHRHPGGLEHQKHGCESQTTSAAS